MPRNKTCGSLVFVFRLDVCEVNISFIDSNVLFYDIIKTSLYRKYPTKGVANKRLNETTNRCHGDSWLVHLWFRLVPDSLQLFTPADCIHASKNDHL